MRRKLTAILLVCLLLVSLVLPAHAASSPKLFATAAEKDGTITVTLSLKAGSGVASGSFALSYDPALKLASSQKGLSMEAVQSAKAGEVTCSWVGGAGAEDKAVLTLTFTNAATKSYAFHVTNIKLNDKAYNTEKENDFTLEVVASCIGTNCPSAAYTDVDTGAWYHSALDYVIANGIMSGYDAKTFDPNGTMTRAMLVTILGRSAGVKEADFTSTSFKDVEKNRWYSAYIEWASKNGIVNGYEDGAFRPNQGVTREEMVTILYRYWLKSGNQAESAKDALKDFADAASISDWAVDAMQWAIANGVVNGVGGGKLDPKGLASRAQVAKIIMVYLQNLA